MRKQGWHDRAVRHRATVSKV